MDYYPFQRITIEPDIWAYAYGYIVLFHTFIQFERAPTLLRKNRPNSHFTDMKRITEYTELSNEYITKIMQKLSATSNFCTIAVHYRAVAYKYKDRTKQPYIIFYFLIF